MRCSRRVSVKLQEEFHSDFAKCSDTRVLLQLLNSRRQRREQNRGSREDRRASSPSPPCRQPTNQMASMATTRPLAAAGRMEGRRDAGNRSRTGVPGNADGSLDAVLSHNTRVHPPEFYGNDPLDADVGSPTAAADANAARVLDDVRPSRSNSRHFLTRRLPHSSSAAA